MLIALPGQLVLRATTRGRLKCQAIGSEDHRIHGASGALWYTQHGRRVVAPTGQALAGLGFYAALALLLVIVGRFI